MAISVNHSVTADFSNQSTLGELKEFVAAAEQAGMPTSSRMFVEHHQGTQRDPSYTKITVRQR